MSPPLQFIILLYFFAFFDVSVEVPTQEIFGTTVGGGRVANLSLMAERQNDHFRVRRACVGAVLLYLGEKKA